MMSKELIRTPVFMVTGEFSPGDGVSMTFVTPSGKSFAVEEILDTCDLKNNVEQYVCRVNGNVEALERRGAAWVALGTFAAC